MLLVRDAPNRCGSKPHFLNQGLKLAQRIVPGLDGGQTLAPGVTGQVNGAVDQRMAQRHYRASYCFPLTS